MDVSITKVGNQYQARFISPNEFPQVYIYPGDSQEQALSELGKFLDERGVLQKN